MSFYQKNKKILLMVFIILATSMLPWFVLADVNETQISYGLLSLVPAVITIILALTTKQTVLSLFAGVWIGTTIMNGLNPFTGFLKSLTDVIIPQISNTWNAGLLLIMVFLGGFLYIISASGAVAAFGQWAEAHVHTRKKAQTLVWLAPFFFLFNQGCLFIGAIMRPITDKMKVSRVKLAYITDALGAPLVSMSPISDNAVFVIGLITVQVTQLGLTDNPWSLYFKMMPYNLYAVFAIITALLVVRAGLDIGPMYHAEKRAIETGKVIGDNDVPIAEAPESEIPKDYNLTSKNFLIPMGTLVITIFATIFWTGDIFNNGFIQSFTNANVQMALAIGFLLAGIAAGVVAVSTGLLSFKVAVDRWTQGTSMMMQVMIILVLAWAIGSVTTSMDVGGYLTSLVQDSLPIGLIPALIFLVGVGISFSTGSSWGVWALGIPIAMPMAQQLGIPLPLAMGAVISGGLFGDHCSPISDTTIQSSTGACCDHIEHVKTQLPYALIVGGASLIGYLVGGFVTPILGIVSTAIIIGVTLFTIHKKQDKLIAYSTQKN